jgi:hypothetical protein
MLATTAIFLLFHHSSKRLGRNARVGVHSSEALVGFDPARSKMVVFLDQDFVRQNQTVLLVGMVFFALVHKPVSPL